MDRKLHRGKMISIKTYNSSTPALARKMIDQSLAVHGGSLFNLLPEELRSFMGTVEEFKTQLDEFLMVIPDHLVCSNLYPEPINKDTCRNSNSLIDWIPYLNIRERRKYVPPLCENQSAPKVKIEYEMGKNSSRLGRS